MVLVNKTIQVTKDNTIYEITLLADAKTSKLELKIQAEKVLNDYFQGNKTFEKYIKKI